MSDLKQLRVLYVEDDDATREAFAKFIKHRVGKLFLAASGEEGKEKFYESKANILIVDLIMPGMSGLEMIGEIRKSDKECRILITSTISEVSTVLEAVDLGIDHYIVKPIDTEELEEKLESMAHTIITSQKEKDHAFSFESVAKKGIIEETIRREFLKIMKIYMGKGPQEVKILLYENKVELIAIDAVTVMEKTLSANRRNIAIVEQFRKLFYEEISFKLEEIVESATGCQSSLTLVNVDGSKRIDKIILTII
jgi:YesN/AraC family two-component response regulator